MVKVLLIVVQGKPEGKAIPVVGPVFRIGRGDECHLKPNSEEVSRRHAEIALGEDGAVVRDLGSRNGTRVNGKLLTGSHKLKSGELLQIGPLTFAVSVQGAPAARPAEAAAPTGAGVKGTSLDDVPADQIDSWLVSDQSSPTPDRPSGVYDGDTLTIAAYKSGSGTTKAPAPPPARDEGIPNFLDQVGDIEQLEEGAGDSVPAEVGEGLDDPEQPPDEMPEEMIDESNPFHVKKPKPDTGEAQIAGKAAANPDSSTAASEILRKMLERRRAR